MVFDSLDEIERQLLAGEDSLAEFKRVELRSQGVRSPNSEDLAGELCAFANAEGGAVFLGVDDDGTVRGIARERRREVEEWVVNLARNNCDPPLLPLVRSVVLPDPDGFDRYVLVVEVRRSLFAHRTPGGRWYVRMGSSKRDLSPTELPRLLQERARAFAFDEAVVPSATGDDLDEKAVDAHARVTGLLDRDQLLQNLQIAQLSDGVLRPTVAGLLAFGKDPAEHIPRAYVHAAVYRGTARTSDDLVNTEDIRGSVDRQVDGTMAFVDRFMLTPARKSSGRQDFPQFDLAAVHEALVNAVAHRDYSITGSRIRLFLYADRLELSSPGALPNTLTVETMRYRQFTRNQLLVSFLSRMKSRRTQRAFIEERGEGVQLILDRSAQLSHREASYEVHGDELLLTIWAAPSPHDFRSDTV